MNPEPRVQLGKTQLSAELANRGSGLNALIDLATLARDKGKIGHQSKIATARKLITRACNSYSPCQCSENCVLCRSGENGKTPFRGKDCRKCSVSQLNASGMFVGEIKRDFVPINQVKQSSPR